MLDFVSVKYFNGIALDAPIFNIFLKNAVKHPRTVSQLEWTELSWNFDHLVIIAFASF